MEIEGSWRGRGRRQLAVMLAAGGVLAMASWVYATIPDAAGVFHACYKLGNGQVKLPVQLKCRHRASARGVQLLYGMQKSRSGKFGRGGTGSARRRRQQNTGRRSAGAA